MSSADRIRGDDFKTAFFLPNHPCPGTPAGYVTRAVDWFRMFARGVCTLNLGTLDRPKESMTRIISLTRTDSHYPVAVCGYVQAVRLPCLS
jgi:hypothetical protein